MNFAERSSGGVTYRVGIKWAFLDIFGGLRVTFTIMVTVRGLWGTATSTLGEWVRVTTCFFAIACDVRGLSHTVLQI